MTIYVALQRRARRAPDDRHALVDVAARASMPPSKMGFRPGIEVTLDNALKMLMVKSPNDVAVMIAEGISGSVEAFADEMNATAAQARPAGIAFRQSERPARSRQVSSARDMAMIARALLKEFPEQSDIFGIGALQLGDQIIPNHNGLLGRYPGADGMKTGFTCAAGFNVVASATHGGRRLIVVVLGSPSPRERTAEAAPCSTRLRPGGRRLVASRGGGEAKVWSSLPSPGVGRAPDMRREICSARNRAAALPPEEEECAPPRLRPSPAAQRRLRAA